jgi:uncharacterized protein YdiU (UPF0061 family)
LKQKDIGFRFDNSYLSLRQMFYRIQKPETVKSPALAVFNRPLAKRLGLDADVLFSSEGVEILVGNRVLPGAALIAQAYAGHQFGQFTMLGDGRALLIGEHQTPDGEKFDIQLKGSGRTTFSRGGDGRAAIGPMLREYIISEAMHALGIPTTRSLAVVTTGETVTREKELPGAVLVRVASGHLRVGTFQYAFAAGSQSDLKALADYAINRHYPKAAQAGNPALELLNEVISRQASLIAQWQSVGFIHGVMNTDNMAISGETIDYGPCAFIDAYNPDTVFSSIDTRGRYAYKNQPSMAEWNLARFAETLLPLLDSNEQQALKLARDALSKFPSRFKQNHHAIMCGKLGLFTDKPEDAALVEALLEAMHRSRADYTNTFLDLTFKSDGGSLMQNQEFAQWHARWLKRLELQPQGKNEVQERMKSFNPAVIPRNHKVEEALDRAETEGDYSGVMQLCAVLSEPYAHTPEQAAYAQPPTKNDPSYKTFCGT